MTTNSELDNQISFLVRQTPLKDSDFLLLIKERISLIVKYMREMQLGSIGDLKVTDNPLSYNAIREHDPVVKSDPLHGTPAKFNLETKGVFSYIVSGHCTSHKTHFHFGDRSRISPATAITHKIWGLTDAGQFLKITSLVIPTPHILKPHSNKYEYRVRRVTIKESTLEGAIIFANIPLQKIWNMLSETVASWVSQKEHSLKLAQRIGHHFETMDRLFALNRKK